MKKQFFAAILVLLSSGATAKVTYDEAIKIDQQLNAANPHTPRTHGFTGAELSLQTSGGSGGEAIFFSQSAADNQTSTRTLVSAASHHCALTYTESYTSNHTSADVYQSGGYWYLKVWTVGNGGAKSAKAMCWPRS
ncbi:TPA: hypothetical protein P7K80_001942 [Vibrio cholerae]|uniref:hypothetical protein n=1 Tax=Vibrio cholerae TaxID=666 RepID=UPI0002C1705E|nr:hypothetical protein [Vibrio cholerae]HAT7601923.1 hypothetical protein [Vibrio cholerae O1]EGQ9333605.1 hypothetical protein [Vibrio cholerae]EMQ19278.1 hypothetical protein VCEC0051_003892 [Vibrio cholerae O1 str. EC-0051]EMQ61102.1 hypothetical protein VCEM1727_003871 [Vibrio cholerae O1 str. EM-1727]KPA02648.1 hypothetical protein AC096_08695 [Vibrio cholerae]